MLRNRYDPMNLFELVPKLGREMDPELVQLDRLLDDDARTRHAPGLTPPALLARMCFRMSPLRPAIAKITGPVIFRLATSLILLP